MKKSLFIMTIVVFITACDDTEDYYFERNEKSSVSLKLSGSEGFLSEVFDTVKIGYSVTVTCKIEDDDMYEGEENKRLYFDTVGGVNIDESKYPDIEIAPLSEGDNIITINIEDAFSVKSSAVLNVYSYKNLAPVSVISIEPQSSDGLYIKIDASGSYENDKGFGGVIEGYNYVIGRFDLETTFSEIYYELPIAGTYKIRVRAKDNDGDWGGAEYQYDTD